MEGDKELSELRVKELAELPVAAPGELRYWPTRHSGTTPYIIATDEEGREVRLFVAENREGKTANGALRGPEGDRAIAYAKRMTDAANALPVVMARITTLEESLRVMVTTEQLEEALTESLREKLPTTLTDMGRMIIVADTLRRLKNMLEVGQ